MISWPTCPMRSMEVRKNIARSFEQGDLAPLAICPHSFHVFNHQHLVNGARTKNHPEFSNKKDCVEATSPRYSIDPRLSQYDSFILRAFTAFLVIDLSLRGRIGAELKSSTLVLVDGLTKDKGACPGGWLLVGKFSIY